MPRLPLVATLAAVICAQAWAEDATVVTKDADPCESVAWSKGQWNSAEVATALADEAPGDLKATSKRSIAFSATFSGKGFQFGSIEPLKPIAIPGKLKSVSLWVNTDGAPNYPLIVNFNDGWSRGEADGKKHEWAVPAGAGWRQVAFQIPADWKQPISIRALTTHNWNAQNAAATAKFLVDAIRVETDIAGADPATGFPPGFVKSTDPKQQTPEAPLLEAGISSGLEAEVFTGVEPAFQLSVRNWRAKPAAGKVTWTVSELRDGVTARRILDGATPVSVDSVEVLPLQPKLPGFGLYRFDAKLAWADGGTTDASIRFAAVPPQPKLDEAALEASPYGLNMHGGSPIFPASMRKAGVQWFRDYAFNYEWMVRAKGDDKKYAGWPWYPPLVAKYAAAGAHILPVLGNSISRAGKMPDSGWRREIGDILLAFPQQKVWELDNEYDGLWTEPARRDQDNHWAVYKAYHKAFADVVTAFGDGVTPVANGEAGIYPERDLELIKSGDFANIAVMNVHHYCGIDAPETNIANANTGGDTSSLRLFHDRLRDEVASARADGKQRPAWLTEFGWDTRVGKVVTDLEQAAYLQRGYLTAFHAGIAKAFWYWEIDGKDAKVFFDGCGLLDYLRQPKLGLAAYAGLTSLLPTPTVCGSLDAGTGTYGYLVRQGDQRIAALWQVDGNPVEVEFASGALRDFLGNPLAGKKARLSSTPVYAVGIDANDRFAKQGSWDLDSPGLLGAAAGDAITIVVGATGDRDKPVAGSVALEPPAGWTAAKGDVSADPGKHGTVELKLEIPAKATAGDYPVGVVVSEEGKPLKRMVVRVLVRPPLSLQVAALSGDPGAVELPITVINSAAHPMAGTLDLKLPAGWSSTQASTKLDALGPGEHRALKIPLTWKDSWGADDEATVTVTPADGAPVKVGIIPAALSLPHLGAFTPDGDLKEWPKSARIPDWALHSPVPGVGASVWLAWTDKGLAVAVQAVDSTFQVSDPRSFWSCDALEFLVDARDRGQPRPGGGGERQFWLVPQPDGSVFAGEWKRGNEIPETKNGIAEVAGKSRKDAKGYVLEALIPSSLIPEIALKGGTKLSGQVLLNVFAKDGLKEVGWPAAKNSGGQLEPQKWPSLVLAP